MASKIEHFAKRDAYMRMVTWAKSDSMSDKQSIMMLPIQKYEAHKIYCEKILHSGSYYYGTPPRYKFLNWLGHKLLEKAWGRSLYL